MAIISISRQLAALGDETARELANTLGYRLVDKAGLDASLEKLGFKQARLDKYDEKKPGFWASLSRDRDDYIHHLKSALLHEAAKDNVVIVGRGAMAIFRNIPDLVSVRLVAPPSIRLERVKNYYRCDEKRAKQILERSDADRAGFHRYFFDMDWDDPSYYLLTLNMGHIHPALAAAQIKLLSESVVSQESEQKSRAIIASLVLAQSVVDKVLYEDGIPIHFLEANVDGGEVVLLGVASAQSSIEAAVASARSVPGVTSVTSEIQVVQEYSVMP